MKNIKIQNKYNYNIENHLYIILGCRIISTMRTIDYFNHFLFLLKKLRKCIIP
jgi:hypothetical protein